MEKTLNSLTETKKQFSCHFYMRIYFLLFLPSSPTSIFLLTKKKKIMSTVFYISKAKSKNDFSEYLEQL